MADTPSRYAGLSFNSPLSLDRADRLVARLAASGPRTVLDIGCGWGELLLRVLATAPDATGMGVDLDADLLARGRANAAALAGRVDFVEKDARAVGAPADVVICIGAAHAFGGTADALTALYHLVEPGGRLLYGDGFWERTPTVQEADGLGATPDEFTDLAGLVDMGIAAGFRPLGIESANRDEWEAFESGYLADLEMRLLENPADEGVRAKADEHRNGWLRGYRDVLGFAYLTLGRPAAR